MPLNLMMRRHTAIEILLLAGFCLSGAAALIYEVVWVRALSLVMGSTTYALSTMLASFMAGLTLGGYLGGIFADRIKNPIRSFAWIEAGIGFFGLVTFIGIKNLSPVYAWIFYSFNLPFSSFSFAQFILSFAVMLIPTTFMGATFPLVLKARAKELGGIGRETGDVYSINNLGAIIGSFAAGFILIPVVGVITTNIIAAGLNLLVALLIFILSPLKTRVWAFVLIFIALLFSILTLYMDYPSYIYSYYKAGHFSSYDNFLKLQAQQKLLFKREDAQGDVMVFMDAADNNLSLVTGGKTEGSASRIGGQIEGVTSPDWANQLLLSYLPLEATHGAKTFLNIGLGTGTTLRAAMSDLGLREIDCVEINPAVLEAVKGYFYPELFADPRINFIVADARNYLSIVPKTYDVISSEPSYPVDRGMSSLFSLEFFGLVKSRLTEKGVFAQWLPGYLLSEDDKKVMIRTFGTAFPYAYVWHVINSDDIILLGSNGPIADPGKIFERVETREKAGGLWRYYRLWLAPEDVKKIAATGGSMDTDDRPYLEFAAARNMLGGER